jgi:hypothetical protein
MRRPVALGLAAIVVVGGTLRLLPPLAAGFPVNDGGLFYLMAEEIRRHGWALPHVTGYNGGGIPFAYPPLAFYLADLIALAGVPLIEVVRFLPAVVSTLTIVALWRLAREILERDGAALAATAAFALLPRSFSWFVMGGGLTRAPGYLFAVLAVAALHRLFARRERAAIVPAALLAGLTALTHPEHAFFVAYTAALLWLVTDRSLAGLGRGAAAALGAAVLASPWWLTVLLRDGATPFVAAAGAGGGSWVTFDPLKTLLLTEEPYLPVLGVTALAGAVIALAERRPFLPLWLLTVFVVQPRNALTAATAPLGLLAGLALDRIVLRGRLGAADDAAEWYVLRRAEQRFRTLVLACLTFYAVHSAAHVVKTDPLLRPLPKPERDAMRWMAAHADRSAGTLVLTWLPFPADRTSEWFPVLAGGRSLGTVQGYEWIPGAFERRWHRADSLQGCGGADAGCLDRWVAAGTDGAAGGFRYVYVRRGCCEPLAAALRSDPAYRVIYEGPGAVVFERAGTG